MDIKKTKLGRWARENKLTPGDIVSLYVSDSTWHRYISEGWIRDIGRYTLTSSGYDQY